MENFNNNFVLLQCNQSTLLYRQGILLNHLNINKMEKLFKIALKCIIDVYARRTSYLKLTMLHSRLGIILLWIILFFYISKIVTFFIGFLFKLYVIWEKFTTFVSRFKHGFNNQFNNSLYVSI